jgi:hypothetical protein
LTTPGASPSEVVEGPRREPGEKEGLEAFDRGSEGQGIGRLRAVEDIVELVSKAEQGADLLFASVPRSFAPDRVELRQCGLRAISS